MDNCYECGVFDPCIVSKIVSIPRAAADKSIENNKGKTLVSEGIDANYQDMINYAIFAMIHIEE